MEKLIQQTRLLIDHYNRVKKEKKENYNVFELYSMERLEKYHTRFISDLLNPKGSHEMGDVFLNLFYDVIHNSLEDNKSEKRVAIPLPTENPSVQEEIRVTSKSQMDIYIKDTCGVQMCIENKIGTSDHHNQLQRYRKYMHDNGSSAMLLYLTPWGDFPNEDQEGKKYGIDYYSISYKEHICIWMNRCLEKVVDYPVLREVIKQYIIIIKKMTNQYMDKQESKDVADIILSDPFAAKRIVDNYHNALNKLGGDLRDKVLEELVRRKEIFLAKHEDLVDLEFEAWNWKHPKANPRMYMKTIAIHVHKGTSKYIVAMETFNLCAHESRARYADGSLFMGRYDNGWSDYLPLFDKKQMLQFLQRYHGKDSSVVTEIADIIEINFQFFL